MRKALGVVFAAMVISLGIFAAPMAQAHCHYFTITATSPVTEGQKVNVTVQRDGNAKPSSVQVTTVNGTAKAPSDYTAVNMRVSFTTEISKSFQISTTQDAVHESDETFSIKLGSAMGCDGSGYVYGDPAVVTIKDNDPAKTPTPAPTHAPATHAPTHAPTAAATASPSPSPSPTATPTPTPSASALAAPASTSKGVSPWVIGGAIGGVLLASAGALLLFRMRRV